MAIVTIKEEELTTVDWIEFYLEKRVQVLELEETILMINLT